MKLGPATMEALRRLADGAWCRTVMSRARPPGTVHGIAARVLVLRGLARDVQRDGIWGVEITQDGVSALAVAAVGRDCDWHRRDHTNYKQPRRYQLLLELLATRPGLTLAEIRDEGLSPKACVNQGLVVGVWDRANLGGSRRTVRRYYIAGDEPPSASTIDRCLAAIAAAPGSTIQDVAAALDADASWDEVVVAMQSVSRKKLARCVGWRPPRWYPLAAEGV